jgi:hypothetical protein
MTTPPAIPGIDLASREAGLIHLALGPEVGEAQLLHLLYWLPRGCELSFYDQYFPGTSSDPGAHVDVQRKGDRFLYRLGNHGWFQDWFSQSAELLAAWMMLNRKAKPGIAEPLATLRVRTGARLPDAFVRP